MYPERLPCTTSSARSTSPLIQNSRLLETPAMAACLPLSQLEARDGLLEVLGEGGELRRRIGGLARAVGSERRDAQDRLHVRGDPRRALGLALGRVRDRSDQLGQAVRHPLD